MVLTLTVFKQLLETFIPLSGPVLVYLKQALAPNPAYVGSERDVMTHCVPVAPRAGGLAGKEGNSERSD